MREENRSNPGKNLSEYNREQKDEVREWIPMPHHSLLISIFCFAKLF